VSRKFLTSVDLTGLQLGNLRLENRTADPGSAYGKGHVYFNTTSNELRWYNGTSWVGLGVSVTEAIATEATARVAGDAATLTSATSYTNTREAAEVANRNTAIAAEATIRATNDAANLVTANAYTDTVGATKSPLFTGYDYEIHVSQVDGNDTTGNGDLLTPVASITKALTLVGAQRKTIIVHPGTYSESPSITTQYTTITGPGLIGGNIVLSGTLSTNTGCTISGIKMTNLTITTPTGQGNVNLLNCEISGTLTKTSNADYTVIRLCDLSAASITGGGLVAIFGGNPNFITVNNASANVIVKSAVTVAPALTSGTLSLVDSVVVAAVTNAVTSAASSIITLANCQLLTSTLSNVAPVVLNGFYSILNCVYDKPSSTLAALSGTGGTTSSIDYFQHINADKFITQGGTSSQFVKGNGSLDSVAYAPLASPALTGTPTSTTATAGTNTTQIATTAFVGTAVSNLVNGAPGALDTLNELATALGNDAALSTTLTNSIATKLPLAGGTMTGTIVGKKITTDFYALDYNDVPHKGAMSDAINGGVGYGIGLMYSVVGEAVGVTVPGLISTAIATEVTNRNAAIASETTARTTAIDSAIAGEVTNRNINIANAKNEAVGISQTYTDTRETAEIAARNAAISTHNTTTTNVHGIADTSLLATQSYTTTAIAANSVIDKAYADTKVATEVTDRNTAINSAISTEVTNRNTAIASEASLRITGDATSLASANTYTDGKFSALTSSAVPEGTNLYYTQERVQDEINNTLVVGTNLTGTYNDTAGTYTLGLSSNVVTLTGTQTLTNKTLTNPYINDTVVLLASSTELNLLDGATVTTAEINKLAGLTATTTELNFVTGVTSAIQTQFSSKSDTTHTHSFQAASNELTALAGLTGVGFVKRTGTNTYAIDTSTYALATSPTINTSIIAGTLSFNLLNTFATTINFGGAATTMAVGSNDATSVLTLNAPTIKSNLTYVNLYDTVATTVKFAGAATSLTIGGTPTGAVTHNYSTNPTASGFTKTVNLATGGATGAVTVVNVGATTDSATSSLNVNIPAAFSGATTVPYPTAGSQAANKEYVDNIASGLTIKNQVVYTTSANLSSVYVNGTSDSTGGLGIGATLTAAVNGALVLDGVGVTTNQRVLVKDQTDAKQNGIYVTTNAGDAVTKWILTRATDFNGNLTAGTIKPGNYIFVTSGTYLANSSWIISTAGTSSVTSGAIKVGTDVITLAQYSGTPLNISTLGNVSIGTWQATPIAEPYIDTAIARLASPTFTGHVHVPVVPVDNADATSKKYVDDLIFASLPYLPDIIPLDDLRYIFDDRESRFPPMFQGVQVPLYNPLRLMINLNGVVQTPSYPEYVWQSMLPLDGFMLDSDGYIAFTQVPPAGSTFDGRVMLGPNVNTIGKAYPFRAMDILLGG
jgi:hypothetical protein